MKKLRQERGRVTCVKSCEAAGKLADWPQGARSLPLTLPRKLCPSLGWEHQCKIWKRVPYFLLFSCSHQNESSDLETDREKLSQSSGGVCDWEVPTGTGYVFLIAKNRKTVWKPQISQQWQLAPRCTWRLPRCPWKALWESLGCRGLGVRAEGPVRSSPVLRGPADRLGVTACAAFRAFPCCWATAGWVLRRMRLPGLRFVSLQALPVPT